jgi:hypothetical protein
MTMALITQDRLMIANFLRGVAAHIFQPRTFVAMSYQESAAAVVAEYLPGFDASHVAADIKLHSPERLVAVADPAASLGLDDRVRALDGVVRIALADGIVDAWDRSVIDWATSYLGLPTVALETLLRQANSWQITA